MRIFMIMLLSAAAFGQDAKQLIDQMIDVSGGQELLYQLKDVEYRYTYQNAKTGKKDVSLERYIFDGELSWARFDEQNNALAQVPGQLVQGFDGAKAWATIDGEAQSDPQILKMADFLRKTNYYWFAMMFKLADPGMTYKYNGERNLEGIPYQIVEVGFEVGVGDVQDTYVLYINPYTHLVDQFLFTVLDFGRKDPLLMRVQYGHVDGLMLPVVRRYIAADWEGTPQGDDWTLEIMQDIKFNQNLDRAAFSPTAN